jgi:hypothetical protein
MSVGTGRPVHVTLSGKVMPATGAEIREAYPVQSGYGRFRLSMTDPDTEAPQYLVDEATGTFYEMDLSDPKRRPTAEPRVYSGRAKVFEPKARPAAPVQPKDQSRVPAESEAPLSKLIYDRIPAEG